MREQENIALAKVKLSSFLPLASRVLRSTCVSLLVAPKVPAFSRVAAELIKMDGKMEDSGLLSFPT
jgi:hypothetical protein